VHFFCGTNVLSMFYIVGLGNPGEEYEGTRHNAGRDAVAGLDIKGAKVLTPDTFMNKSGEAVKPLIKNAKQAEKLVVVHDDLDLPLGTFKISFNKSSGGHKGIESIIKAAKTQAFVRVRIGISSKGTGGKLKKPDILGKFSPREQAVLKKLYKEIHAALAVLVSDGRDKAMSEYN